MTNASTPNQTAHRRVAATVLPVLGVGSVLWWAGREQTVERLETGEFADRSALHYWFVGEPIPVRHDFILQEMSAEDQGTGRYTPRVVSYVRPQVDATALAILEATARGEIDPPFVDDAPASVSTPVVKKAIPAVYAQYEGDEIAWPSDRTAAGYAGRETIERGNAAMMRVKARHDAARAGYGHPVEAGA